MAALKRCSVSERSSMRSLSREIDVPVFLKSNRVMISRSAWSTAFRTSCGSTCETTSNENVSFGMARILYGFGGDGEGVGFRRPRCGTGREGRLVRMAGSHDRAGPGGGRRVRLHLFGPPVPGAAGVGHVVLR